jgi:hypothetical protein
MIYQAIGRLIVWVVLKRFGRQLRIAGALAVVAVCVAGYLAASRSVDEG